LGSMIGYGMTPIATRSIPHGAVVHPVCCIAYSLRAIETRKWQLVCSCWAGSTIIDPRGKIIKQLPPEAGILRTDQL